MKKLILTVLTVSGMLYSAAAQTEKGKVMVGGNISVNIAKAEFVAGTTGRYTYLDIVPNIGFFTGDNLAIGTGIGYQYAKQHESTISEALIVEPMARLYGNISDKFKYFGQASIPLRFGSSQSYVTATNRWEKLDSYTGYGIALSPGFAFFPTPKIGIELGTSGIRYLRTETDPADPGDENTKSSSLSLGNFLAPSVGIKFHL